MIDIDLHIHSAFSNDGEFDVQALAQQCSARGLRTFSLTDHNSVRGIAAAAQCAREVGVGFIPGIEIDCNFRGTDLHLLGYGVNDMSGDFPALETAVAGKVMASFGEMIENARRLGFVVDAEAVLEASGGKLPSAELIAEVMLSDAAYDSPLLDPYRAGGARSDMPYINFYLDYFAQGRPAFVRVEFMTYREAVELVRDNGGVPIVAHPGLNFWGRETVAEQLLRNGAAGLEVFNNYHTPDQAAYFAALTRREKVHMTCGSDFHGKTKPRIAVGQFPVDEGCVDALSNFVNQVNRR